MRFSAAPLLSLLLVLPALWLLHRRAEGVRARRRAQLVDAPLAALLLPTDEPAARRRHVLAGLAGLAAIALALAQPQWGAAERDLVLRGRDIVVVLDVSLSMLAEDVAPTRLAHAKAAARSLVSALSGHSGHRLALVTFAGRPEVRCPLTRDDGLFLERLETASADDLPQRGSAIGSALIKALEMLAAPDPAFTDLVLISDGEDHGGQAVEGARLLAGRGASLYTVGVGDPRQGSVIPLDSGRGQPTLLAYQGEAVLTRLRPGLLTAMADAAGGRYLPVETGDPSLAELYHRDLAPKPQRELETASGTQLAPRFQLALGVALGLLALDALWPAPRRSAA